MNYTLHGICDDGCARAATPGAGQYEVLDARGTAMGSVTVEINELGGHLFQAEIAAPDEETATAAVQRLFADSDVTFMATEAADDDEHDHIVQGDVR